MSVLDPFEKPPEDLVRTFKIYQKLSARNIEEDTNIVDFARGGIPSSFEASGLGTHSTNNDPPFRTLEGGIPASLVVSKYIPGLVVVPSLLPARVQKWLLDRLIHRDLSNHVHITNLHKHYHMPYKLTRSSYPGCNACKQNECHEHLTSFFNASPTSTQQFQPIDPSIHKPLSISRVLQKKLRWITLGGQYDWTAKAYPSQPPPGFPPDITDLVRGCFPEINPEAAIVNIYSPKDTLSLHRDVSEESDQGLVSISIGCEALFIIGLGPSEDQPSKHHVLRLRSGDAIWMSGSARYAWHGVPQVIANSCPTSLQAWPAPEEKESGHQFEPWRGWMSTKRINLNVRQMYAPEGGQDVATKQDSDDLS